MKFWPTFWGSLQSPETYRRVRYEAHGWGMGYALALVALSTLIGSIWLLFMAHLLLVSPRENAPSLLESLTAQIARQLPPMQAANGVLAVDAPQPVIIRLRERVGSHGFDSPFITIDTTGRTTYDSMTTPMLITQRDIITKKSDGGNTIRTLGSLFPDKNRVYTEADLREWLQGVPMALREHLGLFYLITLPVLWGILTAGFFISRAIMLLLIGGVVMLAGNAGPQKLPYMTGVRLSSVAYTPVALCNLLAFVLTFTTASSVTLFVLGSVLAIGAVWLTSPARAA